MPKAVHSYQKALGINSYTCLYNGALITNKVSKALKAEHIEFDSPIPFSLCNTIFSKTKEYSEVLINVYTLNHWYATKNNNWLKKEIQGTNIIPTKIDSLETILKILNKGDKIYKISFMAEERIISNINRRLKSVYPDISVFLPKKTQLEVYSKRSRKEIAMKTISKLYKIKTLKEIIAFGDSITDLGMIKNAGLGIAMLNSPSIVKEKANLIANSNNSNGVSHSLNKIFFTSKSL